MARFGKYKSRRKKAVVEEKIDDTEIEEEIKQKPKRKRKTKPKAGGLKEAKQAIDPPVLQKTAEAVDPFSLMDFDFKVAGSLHHPLVKSASKGMSDYAYRHIQAAAAHILGKKHNGPHIISHAKNVTAKLHHFHEILGSSKQHMQQKINQHSGYKQAVSDAMHSAEKGGGIHFEHEVGAGLGRTLEDVAEDFGDVKQEAVEAKHSYDKINLRDTSVSGMAKNTTSAYSGNFHVAAGYMNAAGAVFRPFRDVFRGAGEGFGVVGTELGKL